MIFSSDWIGVDFGFFWMVVSEERVGTGYAGRGGYG